MGKLSLFIITFSNPNGVFYTGTMLQGQVTIDLKESMKMRAILLKFEGDARVHWTETESSGSDDNSSQTVTYSASEKYFEQDVLLHGIWPSQGRSTTKLPPGRHTFPFQFQLPKNLPSSFEGGEGGGYIRYIVKCKIDKPWKFDHKTKTPFTVIRVLDLNSERRYNQRLQGQEEKRLCCLCCKSGPISASFHLDRIGYVPGEAIRPTAEITNGSNRRITKSYVELKMFTKLHATTKTKTCTRVIGRLNRPGVRGHSEDVWNGEELVIPPLPPSFILGCSIIDVNYTLQLTVEISGTSSKLRIPLELVIGTIPLMSVMQQQYPISPVVHVYEGATACPSAPPMPQYPPDMPPPSYNECVTGRVSIREKDDDHTFGNLDFAPAYTFYNWGHTASALPEPTGKK